MTWFGRSIWSRSSHSTATRGGAPTALRLPKAAFLFFISSRSGDGWLRPRGAVIYMRWATSRAVRRDGWLVLNGKLLALDKVPEAEWIYFSFPPSSTGPALTPALTPITRSPVAAGEIYCLLSFSLSPSEGCRQWAESTGDLTKHQPQFKTKAVHFL